MAVKSYTRPSPCFGADKEQENVFMPNFQDLETLYNQGFNNDVDLMMAKPKYSVLVQGMQREVPSLNTMPDGLTEDEMLDALPAQHLDNNELANMAASYGDEGLRFYESYKARMEQKD